MERKTGGLIVDQVKFDISTEVRVSIERIARLDRSLDKSLRLFDTRRGPLPTEAVVVIIQPWSRRPFGKYLSELTGAF